MAWLLTGLMQLFFLFFVFLSLAVGLMHVGCFGGKILLSSDDFISRWLALEGAWSICFFRKEKYFATEQLLKGIRIG